jgi:glycosyltransferase involved in cell wall biosynthesis
MKILVLGSKEYPMGSNKGGDPQPSGGIEIYVETLIEKLALKKSLKFIVLTRRFKEIKSYKKRGNVEIYRVRWLSGFYFRNISFNLLSFFRAISLDFDVIFSHDLFATIFGIFLSKIKKKPLIAVVHGTASDQPQYLGILRRVLSMLEDFTFTKADMIISLSEEPRRKIEARVGRSLNWKVIPFGIDIKKFADIDKSKAKKGLGIKPDAVVITFVGRLIKVKGVSYLIEALSKIDADFTALIVGSGLDEAHLKQLAKSHELDKKIRFLGFREDIPNILSATDIYVLSSLSEGLSISLLEAKAAGCACVVTDIGLPVEDKKTGLVVKKGDSEELSAAIERLMFNRKLRNNLGKNGKKDVIQNYDWERIIERYVEVFTGFKSK